MKNTEVLKAKVKFIQNLNDALCYSKMTAKYAKENNVPKYKLIGFEGEFVEISRVYASDYTVNNRAQTSEICNLIRSGKIYVTNPSFCNKFFKQKWYQDRFDY